jgi:hypothetical protein
VSGTCILTANLCWKEVRDLPVQLPLNVQINEPRPETNAPKRIKLSELLGSKEAAMQECIIASQTFRKRMQLNRYRRFTESKPASEGYNMFRMFRRSWRRTIEALPTQGIALTVALGRSDLRVTKQAQSKASNCWPARTSFFHAPARWQLSRARGDSADQKSRGGEVGHRNESPEFATQVSLRGVVPQVEASNDRGWSNRGIERQL